MNWCALIFVILGCILGYFVYDAQNQLTTNDIINSKNLDLTNKIAIVTGSNTGIGKETARALLSVNCKVIMAVRNKEKGQNAVNDIHNIQFLQRTIKYINF